MPTVSSVQVSKTDRMCNDNKRTIFTASGIPLTAQDDKRSIEEKLTRLLGPKVVVIEIAGADDSRTADVEFAHEITRTAQAAIDMFEAKLNQFAEDQQL